VVAVHLPMLGSPIPCLFQIHPHSQKGRQFHPPFTFTLRILHRVSAKPFIHQPQTNSCQHLPPIAIHHQSIGQHRYTHRSGTMVVGSGLHSYWQFKSSIGNHFEQNSTKSGDSSAFDRPFKQTVAVDSRQHFAIPAVWSGSRPAPKFAGACHFHQRLYFVVFFFALHDLLH